MTDSLWDMQIMCAKTTVQELRDYVAWDANEIQEAANALDDAASASPKRA